MSPPLSALPAQAGIQAVPNSEPTLLKTKWALVPFPRRRESIPRHRCAGAAAPTSLLPFLCKFSESGGLDIQVGDGRLPPSRMAWRRAAEGRDAGIFNAVIRVHALETRRAPPAQTRMGASYWAVFPPSMTNSAPVT